MKRTLLMALALLAALPAAAQWQPAQVRLLTPWGEKLDPQQVLPEYPRPQLVREKWQNLNGLWDYAILPLDTAPETFEGKILVPFAAESALSGVGERPGADRCLWYERSFTVPASWRGDRVLLHIGASDWKTDVWVNGTTVGSHTGGFTPFCFDITLTLRKGGNTLRIRVWDPTEKGFQPRGKQSDNPNGIWYSSVSGIWQTVWLEAVPQRYILGVQATADLDHKRFTVNVPLSEAAPGDRIEVVLRDGGSVVATAETLPGAPVELPVAEPKLWSPESPFLYDLQVTLRHDGRVVDRVASYTAMRKFSTGRDRNNVPRLMLNDRPLFQFGPLDQGWWPDGLYTAPSDEALRYDIVKTRELGYNMIRKHVKVEPARWYYHCDREGIIVWQDMPSGDISFGNPQWQMTRYFTGEDRQRSPESEACYCKEWREIIDCLRPFVSIGVWIPFNETWGQFKTPEIATWTKAYDPTRLVDAASGGNHYCAGDMLDQHNYPMPGLLIFDADRVSVLGEFGGIGQVVEGHLWEQDRNWGYVRFNTPQQVTDEYERYASSLLDHLRYFSAAVYTQTTDVETEVNGLMTYDRRVMKVDPERIRAINRRVCGALDE